MARPLIVTHHAPDLDAVTAVWLLKRFDSQNYATARIAFVNPGDTLSASQAENLGSQLHQVTHVDTGLGEFDHHQPERGQQFISAASLVYDHIVKIHPELKANRALRTITDFTTHIDHFKEIDWPEPDHIRYHFMIHELIKGIELQDPHDDDSQLNFGLTCLDSAYGILTQRFKAEEIIASEGITFSINAGNALGLLTSNDDTIKIAQKQGFVLVVRKDPKLGNIRIKARPDSKIDLRTLAEVIKAKDQTGSWYSHPSGKMLLNGSSKHRSQQASSLTLDQVIEILKNTL